MLKNRRISKIRQPRGAPLLLLRLVRVEFVVSQTLAVRRPRVLRDFSAALRGGGRHAIQLHPYHEGKDEPDDAHDDECQPC